MMLALGFDSVTERGDEQWALEELERVSVIIILKVNIITFKNTS